MAEQAFQPHKDRPELRPGDGWAQQCADCDAVSPVNSRTVRRCRSCGGDDLLTVYIQECRRCGEPVPDGQLQEHREVCYGS